MSWTQGVWPREEMPAGVIDRLEAQYTEATGEADSIEYITWHEIDGSDAIAQFKNGRAFHIGKRERKT